MLNLLARKDLISTFIQQNINSDIIELSFQKEKLKKNHNFDINFAIEQIAIRQKLHKKFPTLCSNPNFFFHSHFSAEQSSSEQTAEYKASLVKYCTSIDLTGGIGIDSLFFATNSEQHLYCEQNENICDFFKYNINILNKQNIKIHNTSAEIFLKNNTEKFDLLYIDPARRTKHRRNFLLHDFSPNILELQNNLFNTAKNIIIKLSPMLDIKNTINMLKFVREVHIVSVDNECKEMLVLLNAEGIMKKNSFFAVNISSKNGNQIIKLSSEDAELKYSLPQKYIYEPNASIMKIGLWNKFAANFNNLYKLHPNTHLFTSDKIIKTFPGRIFKLNKIENFEAKNIKQNLDKNMKANIAVRNFPYSVNEIKKKLQIQDGGNLYIFATTTIDNRLKILITEKFSPKNLDFYS